MYKNFTFLILLFFVITSCSSQNWDAVKRGLTGQKKLSTDEFLVEKKNPLILPPKFNELPRPSANKKVTEKAETFEDTLKKASKNKTTTPKVGSSSTSSAEKSILKQIKAK
jgi:hypothetical protein